MVMSTVTRIAVMAAPSTVMDPDTFWVRPTAVFAPVPASSSLTRWPANDDVPSARDPDVASTVHIPSKPPPALLLAVGPAEVDTLLSATGGGALPPNTCQSAN